MAAKKRLGRGLTDILAEEGRIGASREMRQLIPVDTPTDNQDNNLPEFGMFGQPRTRQRSTEEDAGELYGVNVSFDTQFVGDARPPKDNYGQGPDRSTRVASHKFVPHPKEQQYLLDKAGIRRNAVEQLGTVYVKFHKYGDVWKYKNVPASVYTSFSTSNSKGRFINQYLNHYSKGRAGSRDDRNNTDDI